MRQEWQVESCPIEVSITVKCERQLACCEIVPGNEEVGFGEKASRWWTGLRHDGRLARSNRIFQPEPFPTRDSLRQQVHVHLVPK